MMGNFLVAPRRGNASFGQEAYPLAMQDRAEIDEMVEAPPLPALGKAPVSIPWVTQSVISSGREEATRPILFGADACYILRSLRP
jgi:hypothetical protein